MLSLWPVLIMDVLLWVLVMPPIVVAAWFVMRLGLCVGNFVFVCKPVPIFLDTLWAKLTRTPRGLRTVRTGYAYQPAACCTYVPEAQGSLT